MVNFWETLLARIRPLLARLAARVDGLPSYAAQFGEVLRIVPHDAVPRNEALHASQPSDWHTDVGPMLWVMLERTLDVPHSGLVTAPTDGVNRLCALASDDSVWRRRGSTHRSLARQPTARVPTRLLDHAACELGLRPGDGVLLLRGAPHRTQDYQAPRVAVALDLEA